jgi:hypothetical protein
MTDLSEPNEPRKPRPSVLDRVGKLCKMGRDSADYLFQVPDDHGEREKVAKILEAILTDKSMRGRKEAPRVINEMKEALNEPPSTMVAEQLQIGFDRLTKLWMSARSGLF